MILEIDFKINTKWYKNKNCCRKKQLIHFKLLY